MNDAPPYCVAVIGQGYVGLPVAQACVAAGHTVIGFDTDQGKVDAITSGISPIDDVTDAALALMIGSGRYAATADPAWMAGCNVYLVTVPTPWRDGQPDLSAVLGAARTVTPLLAGGDLVVLESTVAPGTTRGVFADELDRSGVAYLLGFSPERIDPGNPDWQFENTPKLVSGATPGAARVAAAFYAGICEQVVRCGSLEEAELAKLLENTYRYVNIALVNELGRHARALGVDIWSVVRSAATKPYGFQAFWPGPGVGGHCLPIDPLYLEHGVEQGLRTGFGMIHAARAVNEAQPDYVVTRAGQLLNDDRKPVNGSTVLLLGVAYKAGTADMRETPAIRIVERLRELGAVVLVSDPHLHGDLTGMPDVKVVDAADAHGLAAASDLVILVTDHDEFDYAAIAAAGVPILDTRARLAPQPHIHAL